MGSIVSHIHEIPTIVVNFNQLRNALSSSDTIIINTLPDNQQHCLICHTTPIDQEQDIINTLIQTKRLHTRIIIYGKNNQDTTVYLKYKQLYTLGFTQVRIYIGGMFEWLCLQDIYDSFPTTSQVVDLLEYA